MPVLPLLSPAPLLPAALLLPLMLPLAPLLFMPAVPLAPALEATACDSCILSCLVVSASSRLSLASPLGMRLAVRRDFFVVAVVLPASEALFDCAWLEEGEVPALELF